MKLRFALTPLRLATFVLAWAHVFPARRHLALFFAQPSVGEAWKGFGAAVAVTIYLASPRWQARLLGYLWSSRILGVSPLSVLSLLLIAGHLVPASDHVPRFLACACWADAWRGLGAAVAAVWFAVPLRAQGKALRALGRPRMASVPIAPSAAVTGRPSADRARS